MSFLWIQAALHKLVVVLPDVPRRSFFQQIITVVHLNAQGIEGVDHLGGIGNDGFVLIGQKGQEVVLQFGIREQFHLFGVDQHQFDLRRVLFVQQGDQNGVDPHRFTLPRGTRHQQVGHFGQVRYKNFVGNGFTQGDG